MYLPMYLLSSLILTLCVITLCVRVCHVRVLTFRHFFLSTKEFKKQQTLIYYYYLFRRVGVYNEILYNNTRVRDVVYYIPNIM